VALCAQFFYKAAHSQKLKSRSMVSITKATEKDAALLSELAKITFIQSHGHSAGKEDLDSYMTEKYREDIFKQELSDPLNIYHLLYYNAQPAGFSKIIFDEPYAESIVKNITKLERIYLLKEFYDLKLGKELFDFNAALAKKNNQAGIWLFVWKENERAFKFYKKNGFKIIGSYDFKISERHSNPNYQMVLIFSMQ
jgi:ribosomal protein S18 acetylase RimI-like enzyme